jgi:hypothetical protein
LLPDRPHDRNEQSIHPAVLILTVLMALFRAVAHLIQAAWDTFAVHLQQTELVANF